jgi:hypothetical protein
MQTRFLKKYFQIYKQVVGKLNYVFYVTLSVYRYIHIREAEKLA